MVLAWERLDGRSGHEVGLLLLEKLYREATGESLPPILRTSTGKPYFAHSPFCFSISHTQNHAFCCLSEYNVGLDGEEIGRAVSPAMLTRFLSSEEQTRLGDNPQDAFLRLWVLKEAQAKLTGRGMGNWMKNTDFYPDDQRIQIIDGCYVAVLEENHAF